MKTETADGETVVVPEVCVKAEKLELDVVSHGDDLDNPSEVLAIKEEEPGNKDDLCKTSTHSGAQ